MPSTPPLGVELPGSNVAPGTPARAPGTQFRPPARPHKRVKLSKQGTKRPTSSQGGTAKRVRTTVAEDETLVEEDLMIDSEVIVGEEIGAEILGGLATGFEAFMGIIMAPEVAVAAAGAAVVYEAAALTNELITGQGSDPLGLGDMFKTHRAKHRARRDAKKFGMYGFDNRPSTIIKSIAADMTNSSNPIGLPKTKKVRHTYSSAEGIIARAADANTDSFYVHANSIENPHQDAGDVHNALLYDQMVDLYERYYVTAATVRCDFFHEGGAAEEGAVCGIAVLDDTTTLTKPGHYQEVGNTVWKPINPGEHQTIVFAVKPGTFFGSAAISSDTRLAVTAGSDGRLSDPLYFHFYCAPIAGNAATGAYNVTTLITIEYEVTWFDPKSVAQSTAA